VLFFASDAQSLAYETSLPFRFFSSRVGSYIITVENENQLWREYWVVNKLPWELISCGESRVLILF